MLGIVGRITQSTLINRQVYRFGANIIRLEKSSDWKSVVLENKKPVVVDFYAEWCGPCKRLSPLLEKHADKNKDTVNLVLVDIDNHQELASQYDVQAVPSVQLFVGGAKKDEFVGLPAEARIAKLFETALQK